MADDSINLSIPSLNLGSPATPKQRRKSKSLSSSRSSVRGGPEGDSVTLKKKYGPLPPGIATTPAVTPKKSAQKKKKRKSGSEENHTPSPTPTALLSPSTSTTKRSAKRKVKHSTEDISELDNSDEIPQRTPVSAKRSKKQDTSTDADITNGSQVSKSTKGKKKKKKSDESWEKAVEKARGLPEGAASGDEEDMEVQDEAEADEADKPSKYEKGKKKPLNVLKTAAKKLKKLKTKGEDSDKSTSVKKRKRDESGTTPADSKKPKLEEMKKKDRKLERKKSRSNFEVALRAKKMWEQLRRFDLAPEKRHELSQELYNLIKGRAKELIFAHDTSRVIQSIMKYGAQEHKNALFEELKDDIVEMTKSKYAKFFVRKLLKYGTKAQRNYVFRKLNGNVRKLVKHRDAAEIVECAFNDYANASQRNAMVEEFYGPSFKLYKTAEDRTLDQIMSRHPDKRDMILRNMKETLSVLVDKTVLQYSIVHKVFLEFFTYATPKYQSEMIEIVREGLIHMLHTREGSRVGMICLWNGTAKDRKVIVKSFKTYVNKICKEEYGHLTLLSMFDVVDDTKLVHKVILEEMLKTVHDIALDQYGRKVLLYLLRPRDSVHFHPDVIKILAQGDNNTQSKKERDVRRRELLEPVSRPLIMYIVKHCRELVTNNASLLLLLTILTHTKGDPTAAMQALADVACEPFVAGSLENVHLVEHPAGHLTLKRLIINDGERMKAGDKVLFCGILLDLLPQGALKSWAACNRGCFILISLLELNNPDVSKKVRAELEPVKKSLVKMTFKGAQILLGKLKDG